jgi:SAM-dependent methyltransferase
MTRHAPPVALGERWLEARTPGELEPDDLADRLAFWRAREESFRRFAPFDLEGPGRPPSREDRGLVELWFPVERIARDVHAILRARFGPALEALDPNWDDDALSRARSWLDLRRELASLAHEPLVSRFLERSARDRDAAEALAFETHDHPAFGCSLERYPEVLARIARAAPRGIVRAWDAGCGTGEGTYSLARALGCGACGRPSVQVVGTSPSPWELLMAERRGRPHDAARTRTLRDVARKIDGAPAIGVRFERGDLRRPDQAPREQDVILVAGVLGGAVARPDEVELALRAIAGALAPGGRVYVVDRFRADRARRARELVDELAPRAGLREAAPGEWVLA